MVGLVEPRFGVGVKMARRARETGEQVDTSVRSSQEMVGVDGELEGEVRVVEGLAAPQEEVAAQ
jgi:hypothetical protein